MQFENIEQIARGMCLQHTPLLLLFVFVLIRSDEKQQQQQKREKIMSTRVVVTDTIELIRNTEHTRCVSLTSHTES